MTKLLSQIAVLGGLVLGTCLLIIFYVRSTADTRPLASIIDKENLLHRTPSPKIVFVGGSNVVMGIDSRMVQEKLGRPVVDMGLHGGLGLRFDLNEVKPYVHAGDLIVVSPEYQSFVGLIDGDETILDILYLYPEAVRYLEPSQFVMLASRLPASIQVQFIGLLENVFGREQTAPVYTRQGFDQYGDEVGHLNKPSDIDLSGKHLFGSVPLSVDPESIRVLNEFDAYVKGVGAQVVLVYPPLPDTQYPENQKIIQQICQALHDQSSIPVLGSPSDVIYPVDYFFDTLYHLNARGREERTAKIIDDVQRLEQSQPVTSTCK